MDNENKENIDDKLEDEYGLDIPDSSTVDSQNEDEDYPTEVRIEKAQFSLSHLDTLVNKRKQLKLDPDFQRGGGIWDYKKQRELVESILMGIPIPIIYLFETIDGTWQVVDGRQRITALLNYYSNIYALKDLKILKGDKYQNKKFKDLDVRIQARFEDYQIQCYIIQPPTSERIKYDIFDRVNRGGVRLNNQEMRNALYQGKSTDLLKSLANSDSFKEATENGIENSRMKDRYIILRLLSFFMLRENWFSDSSKTIEFKDLDDFLAKAMTYINLQMPDEKIVLLCQLFDDAMKKIKKYIGHDAFRYNPRQGSKGVRRPINMLLFETLGYVFMASELHFWNLEGIDYGRLKDELENSGYFTGRNESEQSVRNRYDFINKKIEEKL